MIVINFLIIRYVIKTVSIISVDVKKLKWKIYVFTRITKTFFKITLILVYYKV